MLVLLLRLFSVLVHPKQDLPPLQDNEVQKKEGPLLIVTFSVMILTMIVFGIFPPDLLVSPFKDLLNSFQNLMP